MTVTKHLCEELTMSVKKLLFPVFALILVVLMAAPATATLVGPIHIPQQVEVNPDCAYLVENGYINACNAGTNFEDAGVFDGAVQNGITIDNFIYNNDGEAISFDWSAVSSVEIRAVIVKDGNAGTNVYIYPSVVFSDTGLQSPSAKQISHVEFCYDGPTNVPEFPTLAMPLMMIIGLLGAILILKR
ncbi:MAG: hypothetical protein GKC04_07635 [Methanomicrobiales archaeon]|nr:hypothetical protein [Methanomicrobiales archaeon]